MGEGGGGGPLLEETVSTDEDRSQGHDLPFCDEELAKELVDMWEEPQPGGVRQERGTETGPSAGQLAEGTTSARGVADEAGNRGSEPAAGYRGPAVATGQMGRQPLRQPTGAKVRCIFN